MVLTTREGVWYWRRERRCVIDDAFYYQYHMHVFGTKKIYSKYVNISLKQCKQQNKVKHFLACQRAYSYTCERKQTRLDTAVSGIGISGNIPITEGSQIHLKFVAVIWPSWNSTVTKRSFVGAKDFYREHALAYMPMHTCHCLHAHAYMPMRTCPCVHALAYTPLLTPSLSFQPSTSTTIFLKCVGKTSSGWQEGFIVKTH